MDVKNNKIAIKYLEFLNVKPLEFLNMLDSNISIKLYIQIFQKTDSRTT